MRQLHVMHEKWHPYHVDSTMCNLKYFYIHTHVLPILFSPERDYVLLVLQKKSYNNSI